MPAAARTRATIRRMLEAGAPADVAVASVRPPDTDERDTWDELSRILVRAGDSIRHLKDPLTLPAPMRAPFRDYTRTVRVYRERAEELGIPLGGFRAQQSELYFHVNPLQCPVHGLVYTCWGHDYPCPKCIRDALNGREFRNPLILPRVG